MGRVNNNLCSPSRQKMKLEEEKESFRDDDSIVQRKKKLSKLNFIFDQLIEDSIGGVREDRIAKIIPSSSYKKNPDEAAAKYGINPKLLNCKHKKWNKVSKDCMKVLSREEFILMFQNEKIHFIEKIARKTLSRRRKKKVATFISYDDILHRKDKFKDRLRVAGISFTRRRDLRHCSKVEQEEKQIDSNSERERSNEYETKTTKNIVTRKFRADSELIGESFVELELHSQPSNFPAKHEGLSKLSKPLILSRSPSPALSLTYSTSFDTASSQKTAIVPSLKYDTKDLPLYEESISSTRITCSRISERDDEKEEEDCFVFNGLANFLKRSFQGKWNRKPLI